MPETLIAFPENVFDQWKSWVLTLDKRFPSDSDHARAVQEVMARWALLDTFARRIELE